MEVGGVGENRERAAIGDERLEETVGVGHPVVDLESRDAEAGLGIEGKDAAVGIGGWDRGT